MYRAFCILCDIWIWLFDFQMWCQGFDISFLLSSFGVLWRPRSRRGPCKVGYIVSTSWEPPFWKLKTAVSMNCELCSCKATFSDNFINVSLSFWLASWGSQKMKTFAVDVERKWRKINQRVSAEIMAIRSPLLFFWELVRNLWAEISQEMPDKAANFSRKAGNGRYFYGKQRRFRVFISRCSAVIVQKF